jgi:hypothetical protein
LTPQALAVGALKGEKNVIITKTAFFLYNVKMINND